MKNSAHYLRFGDLTFALFGALPSGGGESDLPRFEVSDAAAPDVCVTVRLKTPLRLPENAALRSRTTYLRVFETADTRYLCYRDADAEGREYAITQYALASPDDITLEFDESRCRYTNERLLSVIALEQLLLRHRRAFLHAACVELYGRALVFTGFSGTGKSTQAALWAQHRGAHICNGDKTLLRFAADGTLLAQGLPLAGTSGICSRFTLPVAAIVFPEKGRENSAVRLAAPQAVKMLLTQMPVQAWSKPCVQAALDIAAAAAQRVPVLRLTCLPDETAVYCLESELRGELRR